VSEKKSNPKSLGKRGLARLTIVQGLYQMQIAEHDKDEILSQVRERQQYQEIDKTYFTEVFTSICDDYDQYFMELQDYLDRPIEQIDPIELGILILGYYELRIKLDTDVPVIINEAVNLAKCFGSQDGHKYINAILDKAAKKVRNNLK